MDRALDDIASVRASGAPHDLPRGSLYSGLLLGVLLGVGPAVLAFLSRFGPTPVDRVPVLAVALYGAVFVGSLFDLASGLPRRVAARRLGLTFAVGVASALASLALPLGGAGALLAPVTAALVTFLLLIAGSARWSGLLAAATVYVAATLLANFTLDSFVPLGTFFLLNVGTLFFGLTFTQRDRLHRYGRRVVYTVILTAALVNVALASSLGTPQRFVAVSFLTILVSEAADTEVYQRLLGRSWLVRVASSNAVSAPLDTVLFTLLAFWGQPYATAGWMTQVIVTDVLVKYAAGFAAALGMIALLRSALPRRAQRGEDVPSG